MRVLGIDPGATGGLALRHDNGADVFDMPVRVVRRGKSDKAEVDAHALLRLLRELAPIDVAYLEKVGGFAGQGAGSAFNFGRGVGTVEGLLVSVGVPIERVAPLVWQKAMKAIGGKNGSRARACDLFPALAHLFARAKDDGRAEALLIACYGILDRKAEGIFG